MKKFRCLTHKRMLILLLVCCLLAVGCANVAFPEAELSQEKTTSERLDELVSSLPQIDPYPEDGEPFTVLTSAPSTFIADEETAGSVKNLLQSRNNLLEANYGIRLQAAAIEDDEIAEVLRSAEASGTPAGDLLCFPAETTVSLWAAGLLGDTKLLPYFSELPAVQESIAAGTAGTYVNSLQAGNALYMLPDPSAQSNGQAYVLFYDRELVRSTGLPLPETAVQDGTWTISRFQTYAERVAASVMGRDSYDVKTDIFGYSSDDNDKLLPYLLWLAEGYTPFIRDARGATVFAYDVQALESSSSSLLALYNSASRHPQDGAQAYSAFADGRLGFLLTELDYIKELYANSTRSYGILPLPKATADSKLPTESGYLCPIGVSGRVLSVPNTLQDDKRTGLVLRVLYASGDLLREAERETYVALYSTDNDQTCMLELILQSTRFDFGLVYGKTEKSIRKLSTEMFSDVFAEGSRFTYVLREQADAFSQYSAAKFPQIP